ncbi:hypothetical protein BK648_06375 [Pseudomonas poae]|uniref:Uncharacterized protein n=1 Tax=Pseudomonas poae TaxID=200451 RepID=A0A423FDK8_9PSED|nr:hypothetical protein [Pseudomonas poae]ROM55122.1 hypothetical protein BK648_06375 [Pseudomonas poae]
MDTTDNSLLATQALKKLAANKTYRELFLASDTLCDFLRPPALRYIISEDRLHLLRRVAEFPQNIFLALDDVASQRPSETSNHY